MCSLSNRTSGSNMQGIVSTLSRLKIVPTIKNFIYRCTIKNQIHLPPDFIQPDPNPCTPSCHYHPSNITIPFSHTKSMQSSFVPFTTALWNSIPPSIRSPSLIFLQTTFAKYSTYPHLIMNFHIITCNYGHY